MNAEGCYIFSCGCVYRMVREGASYCWQVEVFCENHSHYDRSKIISNHSPEFYYNAQPISKLEVSILKLKYWDGKK